MSANRVEVEAFGMDALKKLMRDISGPSGRDFDHKPQVEYLESYFSTIKPLTMVIEHEYVDRDYLEDYSAYYVRCFQPYSRFCKRILFFEHPFKNEHFFELLKGTASSLTEDLLRDTFLGFIVLKPLPFTVIGRTCLKTYQNQGERSYPINRKYTVHLCGIDLTIDSLAFQEQDSVAAACATSALWSAFHATGYKFQHAIPTPIEITKMAASNEIGTGRTFPNDGLTLPQMAHAVRSVGLEPHTFASIEAITFKSSVYSYLSAGIPIVLAVKLWDTGSTPPTLVGGHAMAITGFGERTGTPPPAIPNQMLDESTQVNRVYVHDDGIGPFARMELDGVSVRTPEGDRFSLSTSWKSSGGTKGVVRAVPEVMIVPVYHKIRIPMRRIHTEVLQFDKLTETIRSQGFIPSLASRLSWKIQLTTSNEVKRDVASNRTMDADYRVDLLQTPLPRFMGRAFASCGSRPIVELLFDLTGIDQAKPFLTAIPHDLIFVGEIKTVANDPAVESKWSTSPAWNLYSWFKTH